LINLGFTTKGKLPAVLIIPSSWGSQQAVTCKPPARLFLAPLPGIEEEEAPTPTTCHQLFWRHCRGGRRLLQGESLTLNLLLCYCFALLYFCLHCFIKNTKKLVPTTVVIFVGLLLSCFIMLSSNGWFL
jgi:hypothetical protein